MEEFWFRTSFLEVEPGEEEETNPHCYGKQLARWMQAELATRGYPGIELVPEDWGWCVLCHRDPFKLWVGCGSCLTSEEQRNSDSTPRGEDLIWHCFVVAEKPFLKKLFGGPDTTIATVRLAEQVRQVLASDSRIQFVEAP